MNHEGLSHEGLSHMVQTVKVEPANEDAQAQCYRPVHEVNKREGP